MLRQLVLLACAPPHLPLSISTSLLSVLWQDSESRMRLILHPMSPAPLKPGQDQHNSWFRCSTRRPCRSSWATRVKFAFAGQKVHPKGLLVLCSLECCIAHKNVPHSDHRTHMLHSLSILQRNVSWDWPGPVRVSGLDP